MIGARGQEAASTPALEPSAQRGERTVKGSHIQQAEEWVDARLGVGTFKGLGASAGPEWGLVLPGGWYDVGVLCGALRAVSKRVGVSVTEISTQICKRNAEADLTSLYRVFLRIAQPRRVLTHTPKLWSTYVSFGAASAIVNEPGKYEGRGTGFPEELLEWGCGCWQGFIPTAIALAGGKDIRASVKHSRDRVGQYTIDLNVTYR